MDKLQAARVCRPDTAWNMRGTVLEQAIDGASRVSVPSESELIAAGYTPEN
jgi:hypothetical protein